MGTEVLWPHDLLNERLRGSHASSSSSSFHRRKNFPANGNLTRLVVNNNNRRPQGNGRKTPPRAEKKKIIAAADNDSAKKADAPAAVGRQVTLLRRGESLDSLISKTKSSGKPKIRAQPVDDLAVLGTARIGPESPEMAPTRIHLTVYAGSVCSLSPSPKALPLPSFFSKKQNDSVSAANPDSDTDSATRNLRRLLRLN